MAFTEEQKLSLLKELCKQAVAQGTSWADFKEEFAAFSEDFKNEVKDLFDAKIAAKIAAIDSSVVAHGDEKVNVQDLKEELFEE